MATPVTISTAVINYTSGTTDCQCSIETTVLSIGTTYVGMSVSLNSADLSPDWTDDELCAAVAIKLNVPVTDVSVASPPPPAPEPTPEPDDNEVPPTTEGNG